MKTKNVFGLLVVIFILFIIAVAWLVVRIYVPSNPVDVYFPSKQSKVPVVGWMLVEFRPIFLMSFSKDNKDYIKVLYRNSKKQIKTLDVMVGSKGDRGLPLLGVVGYSGDFNSVSTTMDYGKYFRIGDRLAIEYLRNVIARSNTDSEDALMPDGDEAEKLCKQLKTICFNKENVFDHPESYWDFQLTGDWPKERDFVATKLIQMKN